MIIADTYTTGMISVNVECDYISKYAVMKMMIMMMKNDERNALCTMNSAANQDW